MKYNKLSEFERPPEECPRTCGECRYYADGACTANGCHNLTLPFSRPEDRPLPMPLACPWWYMNRVWRNADDEALKEYREMRLHDLVASAFLEDVEDLCKRKEFVSHHLRRGGGRTIDFWRYPEAYAVYKDILRRDGGRV